MDSDLAIWMGRVNERKEMGALELMDRLGKHEYLTTEVFIVFSYVSIN